MALLLAGGGGAEGPAAAAAEVGGGGGGKMAMLRPTECVVDCVMRLERNVDVTGVSAVLSVDMEGGP